MTTTAAAGLSTPHIWPRLEDVQTRCEDVLQMYRVCGVPQLQQMDAPEAGLQLPNGRDLWSFDRTATTIAYAVNGASCGLTFARDKLKQVGGGVRALITQFSAGSRQRFLHKVMSVDRELVTAGRCLFVTLTYPAQWNEDRRVWKRDLQAFRKRLKRAYGTVPGWWKLEFQKRGAPHFHLLLLWETKVNGDAMRQLQQWCSQAWYEVVRSGDAKHLAAGTNVQTVSSWEAVAKYAGKYLGKLQGRRINQETGEVLEIGRVWGEWHSDLIPRMYEAIALTHDEAVMIRRQLRRLAGRRSTAKLQGMKVFALADTAKRLFRWAQLAGIENRRLCPTRC